MKIHERSPNTTLILIVFSLLLVGAAQITALWTLSKAIVFNVVKSPTVEELQPAKFSPQVYQLKIVNNQIQLTPRAISTAATSAKLALTEAFEALLAQSSTGNATSTIPPQTRLLDLNISENGIHIDLSQEFTQGGGSSSMIYRVAQVLYTATSMDSQATVFLSIEGKPLRDDYPLGGEGLILKYPMTRQQFDQDFLTK
ncbi:MAG: GerMN domain-containing protein [Cyanobacteria bacterium J06642_3]